ncbi:hypothetical protein BDN70DRAFT_482134 [Pholiota conissans]|uniref:Uncharacterized protein n=1 Tax=Pholiota conissans TaxID=109636 RepID=A0A9P5YN76_9AGAR|nr:hypothetical protein BDN70DRAFT_482134 [Pholiota conissans]
MLLLQRCTSCMSGYVRSRISAFAGLHISIRADLMHHNMQHRAVIGMICLLLFLSNASVRARNDRAEGSGDVGRCLGYPMRLAHRNRTGIPKPHRLHARNLNANSDVTSALLLQRRTSCESAYLRSYTRLSYFQNSNRI